MCRENVVALQSMFEKACCIGTHTISLGIKGGSLEKRIGMVFLYDVILHMYMYLWSPHGQSWFSCSLHEGLDTKASTSTSSSCNTSTSSCERQCESSMSMSSSLLDKLRAPWPSDLGHTQTIHFCQLERSGPSAETADQSVDSLWSGGRVIANLMVLLTGCLWHRNCS